MFGEFFMMIYSVPSLIQSIKVSLSRVELIH